jgi:hypothetical protein
MRSFSGPRSNKSERTRSRAATPPTTVPGLRLLHNYPNPFNPWTTIPFFVPSKMHVEISVYDARGRCVAILLSKVLEAGAKSVRWDGCDTGGDAVATGVYFCRLVAGDETLTKKMVLRK